MLKREIINFYNNYPLKEGEHPSWDLDYSSLSGKDKGILLFLMLKRVIFRPRLYQKFFKQLNNKERINGFFLSLLKKNRLSMIGKYKQLYKKSVSRREFRYKILLKYMGKKNNILDIGCGTSPYYNKISIGNKYTGVDASSKMIEYARRTWHSNNFILGDAKNLPFSDKEFDVACCFGVLMFYKNVEGYLNEMIRVTKKTVLFDVIDCNELPYVSPWWAGSLLNYYLGRYHEPVQHNIAEIRRFMQKKGFRLEKEFTFIDGISNNNKVLVFESKV